MYNRKLQIGFIGGGNMAQAIINGLLEAGHDPACLYIADPSAEQRKHLQGLRANLHVGDDNIAVAEQVEILILAVKPQIIDAVAAQLQKANRPDGQLVISIAAGITLQSLREALDPVAAIVRIMPNQPALIGAGMSVLVGTSATNQAHRDQAQYVADSTGEAVWIEDESLMDAVTAISGSGPAYFYLLMEIMEAGAKQMGLPEPLARLLTRQTGLGAGRVATESEIDLQELRESVTSRGGTTEAAINVLEQEGIRDIVWKALVAARDRSVEIGAPGVTAGDTDKSEDKNSLKRD